MNEIQRPALVLGLGNPTDKHAGNRHNVGFWFADELASRGGGHFSLEKNFVLDALVYNSESRFRTARIFRTTSGCS